MYGNITLHSLCYLARVRPVDQTADGLKKLVQLEHLHSENTHATPWLPILLIHIGQSRDKVKVTNLKKIAKKKSFGILLYTWHTIGSCLITYEMDPVSFVQDTEQTRFHPQMYRRTDGQTDVKPVYPPFNFVESRGIIRCIVTDMALPWCTVKPLI